MATQYSYITEFRKELDARFSAYKKGKAKLVSAAESKRRIEKILKQKMQSRK